MTLRDIKKLLEITGYPVAYRQFKSQTTVPYITYTIPNEEIYGADDKNFISSKSVRVELYTNIKDTVAEKKVETALNFVEFEKSETYIDSERLFMIVYEFELTQKIEEE